MSNWGDLKKREFYHAETHLPCTNCKEVKHQSEFTIEYRFDKVFFRHKCKKCTNEYYANKRKNDGDKMREYHRNYQREYRKLAKK